MMFKALGTVRLSAGITDKTAHWLYAKVAPRPLFRLVYMNRNGRVFRVAPGEWDHDRKDTRTDPTYRPYRQINVRIWRAWVMGTQKRPGLGITQVLKEHAQIRRTGTRNWG